MSDNDDPLRKLPVLMAEADARPAARQAFARAFDPWHLRVLGIFSRSLVPVALASIVGLYLTWAFAAAISLNN